MIILVNLFLLSLAGNEGIVLLTPPPPLDVCDDGQVSIPACSFLTAFRNCTIHDSGKVGVTGEPLQLALPPRKIASTLSDNAFNTSSGIARVLGAITRHFDWHQLLIVADLSNLYFLRTAEEFYKITVLPSSSEITIVQPRGNDEVNDVIDMIDKENLRIIVLSVRPSIVQEILCIAQEKK